MEHISNEEKARVLSIKGSLGVYIRTDIGILATEETKKRLSLYGACLEAMEWKDEQHEQEKREWLNEAYDGLKPLLDPDSLMVVQQKLSELVYKMEIIE